MMCCYSKFDGIDLAICAIYAELVSIYMLMNKYFDVGDDSWLLKLPRYSQLRLLDRQRAT